MLWGEAGCEVRLGVGTLDVRGRFAVCRDVGSRRLQERAHCVTELSVSPIS